MLSIVVPTKNRARFLARLLRFLRDAGIPWDVIICDSSDADHFAQTEGVIAGLQSSLRIEHRRYPGDDSNFQCLADCLATLRTSYAVWNADDDFLLAPALRHAIAFLDPDYAVVHGVVALLAVRGDEVNGEVVGVRCHVVTHDMRGASNGRATGEDDGYLKLVFDGAQERLLGVQMVNYAGAELIQMAALAIRSGAGASVLATQLSVHPSHAERFIKIAAHDHHEICEVPERHGAGGGA